jgi:hypothetical protein
MLEIVFNLLFFITHVCTREGDNDIDGKNMCIFDPCVEEMANFWKTTTNGSSRGRDGFGSS